MITYVYILNIEIEKILGFRMQGTVKIICKVPCLRPKSSKELAPNKGKYSHGKDKTKQNKWPH